MKIAVLTNAYPSKTHGGAPHQMVQGGAGRIAFAYVKSLEGLGHEVKIWGPDPKFYLLLKWPASIRLIFHLLDLRPRRKIVNDIVAWKPDVLMTHNLTGCGFGTPRRVKVSGARWLHVLHDVQLFEPSGQIIHGEKHAWLRRMWRSGWSLLRKHALGRPDVVISPTKWLLDQHVSHGFFIATQKAILSNPVEFSAASDASERDARKIIYVGRLDADKGIDLLMSVWPRLREAASGLVLAGGGSRLEYLKGLKDEKLQVRGALPHDQVTELMRRGGVLALPSLVMENQPTVILEALAAGCKVVAANVGGVRETLGLTGWIFKPGDTQSLFEALLQALQSGDNPLRESARMEVLKLHDPKVFAAGLAGLLKSNL